MAVATKPFFLLFLPAVLLSLLLRHKSLNLFKVFWFGVLGVFVPILVWVVLQFDATTLAAVISVYANPHNVSVGSSILANAWRLITEAQPLYFLGALSVWAISWGVRRWRREGVSAAEECLLFFSVLVALAYLRTTGYYRYFFPAQVFALLYLPHSLLYLAKLCGKRYVSIGTVVLVLLIAYQAHATVFRSWVAVHYNATRTQALELYFETLPDTQEVFVYQAPEAMSFVGSRPTYQYVEITSTIAAGRAYQSRVHTGVSPLVVTPTDFYATHQLNIFSHYTSTAIVDGYSILVVK